MAGKRYSSREQIIQRIEKAKATLPVLREKQITLLREIPEWVNRRDEAEHQGDYESAKIHKNHIAKLQKEADELGKLAAYREDVYLKHLGQKLAEFDTLPMSFLQDGSVPVKITKQKNLLD